MAPLELLHRSPFRRRFALLCGAAVLFVAAHTVRAENDLAPLSDEFGDPSTLTHWLAVDQTEGWNANQLETWDTHASTPGHMTMMPYTCTWYANYRGPLAYKVVTGDFALTTAVQSTGRDGASVPQSSYSLGGIMLRTPRAITPQTWMPGGENFVFLSLGYGSVIPRAFQYEVKTTTNSVSTLILSPAPSSSALLQLARVGDYVIALRQDAGGSWVVHRRYARADFPDTLQAGVVSYTDWNKVQYFDPFVHNSTVLDPPLPPGVVDPRPDVPFAPDLLARFDYARYVRVVLPPHLVGVDLTNPSLVPDSDLLAFLGENANLPAPTSAGVRAPRAVLSLEVVRTLEGVRIRVAGDGPARVHVRVYDVRGREVAQLGDHALPADLVWKAEGAGVFVLTAETASARAARRLVLAR